MSEHLVTDALILQADAECDALTMQLNVVKAITESSAVSLGFWRHPSDTDMQTT